MQVHPPVCPARFDPPDRGGVGPWEPPARASAPRASASVLLVLFALATGGAAFALAPPGAAAAVDTPNDSGGSITVSWTSASDDTGDGSVVGYEVLRAGPPEALGHKEQETWTGVPRQEDYRILGVASAGQRSYRDPGTHDGRRYFYRVAAVGPDGGKAWSPVVGPARSAPQWLDLGKIWIFLIAGLIGVAMVLYIETARRGRPMFVRRIAALEAIKEAVGRATEMGRPIVYVPGIHDMNDIQTVAGITILAYVARTVAEYDTRLVVPTARSLVMTTARETVRQACLSAGRPDSYRETDIYYTTDEQFGYVAAVSGVLMRDRPATCFYMGAFLAESLILAETGNTVGAIQIAGTAQPAQLPFFVAACDYTLIGEELFAASAYLSGDPRQLGSLKGQDLGKMIAIASLVAGIALTTAAALTGSAALQGAADAFLTVFRVT